MSDSNNVNMTPQPKPTNKTFRFLLIGTIVCFLLLFTPAVWLLIIPIIVLIVGAVPYFIYLIIRTVRNRQTERNAISSYSENEKQALLNHPAAHFKTNAQQYTRIFNIIFILAVIPFLWIAFSFYFTPVEARGTVAGLLSIGGILFTIVIATGILSTVTSFPLMHDKQLRLAEQYAIRTRTGAWNVIRNNRIFIWIVWIIGASLIPLLIVGAMTIETLKTGY
jgi:Ca2+/Na+ antiporter